MKRFLISVFAIFLNLSCNSGIHGSCSVEKPATEFANLIWSGKWEEAKEKCTNKGIAFIDSCDKNSVFLNMTNVYDVRCMVKEKLAICEFCCTSDTIKRTFTMIKTKEGGGYINVCGTWMADDLSGLITEKNRDAFSH